MSSVEIQSVIGQLRALQARSTGLQDQSSASAPAKTDFGDLIGKAISHVNETQTTAADTAKAFELGEPNVSLTDVMLASSRSQVEFTALTQVRSRFVRAYQDIMNMPI